MESRNSNQPENNMNFLQIAKNRGAKAVNLKIERHAIYESKSGSSFNISNVKAYRLNNSYFWSNVRASRKGEWLESDKACWLIIEESAA
jgi:hypothetical protein